MEIKDTYLTISSNAEGIFRDKGSKFIAYAYPVCSEDQIKELILFLKKEHYSARHHCYAYRLGFNGENYRANDDGEPSGTAGKPILNQLLSAELTNILIVVVRYFGGTLLGVSGLINAYKNATIDAIQHAEIISKVIENLYLLEFEYPLQNAVMRVIKDEKLTVLKTSYEMNCLLTISIRLNKTEIAINKFSKIEGLRIKEVE
jgi:uncharacterized YigZ family protein